MKYLDGRAFEFFYDNFPEDRQLTEDGKHYEKVDQTTMNKFGKKDRPENIVRRAPKPILDLNNKAWKRDKV